MAGKKKEQPATTVARLPTFTDPAVRNAQQRASLARRRSSGRMSTILTDSLRDMVGARGLLGA